MCVHVNYKSIFHMIQFQFLTGTVMTQAFYNYVICDFEAHFNATRTHKTLSTIWIENCWSKLRCNSRQRYSRSIAWACNYLQYLLKIIIDN